MQPRSTAVHTAAPDMADAAACNHHEEQQPASAAVLDHSSESHLTSSASDVSPADSRPGPVTEVAVLPATSSSVSAVVECLRLEEVLALPTDTLYGEILHQFCGQIAIRVPSHSPRGQLLHTRAAAGATVGKAQQDYKHRLRCCLESSACQRAELLGCVPGRLWRLRQQREGHSGHLQNQGAACKLALGNMRG